MLRRVCRGGWKSRRQEGEEQWRCALLDDYYGIFFFFHRNQWIGTFPLLPHGFNIYLNVLSINITRLVL